MSMTREEALKAIQDGTYVLARTERILTKFDNRNFDEIEPKKMRDAIGATRQCMEAIISLLGENNDARNNP